MDRFESLREELEKEGYSMRMARYRGKPALVLELRVPRAPQGPDYSRLSLILDFYLPTWDWAEDGPSYGGKEVIVYELQDR